MFLSAFKPTSPCGPRRRSRVPDLLPGDDADPPDSIDDVMEGGKDEDEEEFSAAVVADPPQLT